MAELEALQALLGQLSSSPAMKKMAELDKKAEAAGLDADATKELVPVVCKFMMHHNAQDKTGEAAEFVAAVVIAAADFPNEVADVLEKMT